MVKPAKECLQPLFQQKTKMPLVRFLHLSQAVTSSYCYKLFDSDFQGYVRSEVHAHTQGMGEVKNLRKNSSYKPFSDFNSAIAY